MSDTEQAKQYLTQRLSAELSFQNNLSTIIDTYAYRIVEYAYQANIPPTLFSFRYNSKLRDKVEDTVQQMLNMIESVTETLAVSTHTENKDKIIARTKRDIQGKDYNQRLTQHCDTFKKEIEGIIAAGLPIGALKSETFAGYKQYRRTPYLNPMFKKAAAMNQGAADVLRNKGLHLGIGQSNSSYNAINTLGRFTIGDAWMYDGYLDMDAQGAIGYIGHRGSSYPCQECDDNAGRFHSLSEGMIYPLHPNCVCYVTPVFE